ncbi:YkgJ family cysteine cluster protein [Geotalea sp. SG265]|uniref:YkgJ family cysteine cluster protein n=1 Tax=Geotalea sp. SG265 TaxID=2922867 RepID=UPI001FAF4395|nr:YkgJ family cysteine cluster protein [Geotalea sp. SG265]
MLWLTVSVLFPEAMVIARHLQRTGRADMLPVLKDFVARIRWMEDGERAWRGIFCPFLDQAGACSIHPVRPLLCRSITSTDPASCRAALNQTEESEAPLVIMNMVQKQIVESIFIQLATSLQEAGRDSRSVELASAVSAIIEQPGLEEDFARGGPGGYMERIRNN